MSQDAANHCKFVAQTQYEAQAKMQAASTAELEHGRKLIQCQQNAEALRTQLATAEQRIHEQDRQ